MPGIRIAVAGVALGSAMLFQPTHAMPPPPPTVPTPVAPPAEFADYIAQVRLADAMPDEEARCNAHPDLPGNQWLAGAAQGRCAMLRAPALTLDKIDSLLATPAGVAALESGFAGLLDAHYRDPAQRDQIFIAVRVFDKRPRAGEISQRWLQAAPESAFAKLAAGAHFAAAGWSERGTAVASRTSPRQLERMHGYFAQAIPLLTQVLEIEPRLTPACTRLNAIGRQSSDALETFAATHCRKTDPDSYFVEGELIRAAEPRWSGSHEALERAVAFAASRTEHNPALGVFLGDAAGYEASAADSHGEVVQTLVAAANMGPNPTLLADAGSGYWDIRQHWLAVVYYSQALRFEPNDAWNRYARAGLMTDHFRDYDWARSDMRIALQKEPDEPRFLLLMGDIARVTETSAAARDYYRRAMEGDSRGEAMLRYCQTFLTPMMPKEADACTHDLVTEFANSASAWLTRARALAPHDADAALAALEQVKVLADPQKSFDRRTVVRAQELEEELKARSTQTPVRPAGR
ncbi:tetratricopeptide repeat protein [Lysobacter auxotrophicus]|uniref:DUF4034 domain-containing protein n=1 Tax=Lysobacter auxotrophicus TaxID=2992573 RepID=A0ABM8DET7_9GAMM|nr:hypothetical protein [Lysobacter auxotrophicus]BDU17093.1 DUF4034 domain-containing protein [Lysobacter auxotrophicus]